MPRIAGRDAPVAEGTLLGLLANFDEGHGLVGLSELFPNVKIMLGATFGVLFVVFRIVLWPYFTFHLVSDILTCLRWRAWQSDRGAKLRRPLIFMLAVAASLTLLQFYWLALIVELGVKEITMRK